MSNFKNVVGHKDIIQYIENAVKENKVSHAYIFNGEKGVGKKLLARLFAMRLQCQAPMEDGAACGQCQSCLQIMHNNHPDVIWVTHEKPTSIGVNDIRVQLNQDMGIKPYNSKHKIYIVPDADLMTVEAQNALLKTLEEPPEYGMILLLTENAEILLPTIRSRCVILKLRNVKDVLIKKYLMEKMQVPDYKADICVAFAQGNMGRAIMLAESEHFNEIRTQAIELLTSINSMELYEVIAAVKSITSFKLEITDYLDIISIWYRDVLIYKATKNPERVVFSDQLEHIKERTEKSSYEGIEKILQSIETAKARIKANVNFELLMELLFLTIKEN